MTIALRRTQNINVRRRSTRGSNPRINQRHRLRADSRNRHISIRNLAERALDTRNSGIKTVNATTALLSNKINILAEDLFTENSLLVLALHLSLEDGNSFSIGGGFISQRSNERIELISQASIILKGLLIHCGIISIAVVLSLELSILSLKMTDVLNLGNSAIVTTATVITEKISKNTVATSVGVQNSKRSTRNAETKPRTCNTFRSKLCHNNFLINQSLYSGGNCLFNS